METKKNLENLTEIELIIEIFKCDKQILHLISWKDGEMDFYPGAIMGLGDFYCEKSILINELLRRKHDSK